MINIQNNDYFEIFFFNGGEVGIKWKQDPRNIIRVVGSHGTVDKTKLTLFARLKTANDIMALVVLNDALRRITTVPIELVSPYIPAGRQDRVADYGDPLSIKVYTDLINSCKFDKIYTIDAHSNVTEALLNNIVIMPIYHELNNIIEKKKYNTIIVSDAGVLKKMHTYYFPERQDLKFVQCLKTRDTVTGKLSNFRIVDSIVDGDNCLLADDLIDGGYTAYKLGELIKTTTNCNILGGYFTHGIFSKGSEYLYQYFDELYTTNSWQEEYNDKKLNVIKIF